VAIALSKEEHDDSSSDSGIGVAMALCTPLTSLGLMDVVLSAVIARLEARVHAKTVDGQTQVVTEINRQLPSFVTKLSHCVLNQDWLGIGRGWDSTCSEKVYAFYGRGCCVGNSATVGWRDQSAELVQFMDKAARFLQQSGNSQHSNPNGGSRTQLQNTLLLFSKLKHFHAMWSSTIRNGALEMQEIQLEGRRSFSHRPRKAKLTAIDPELRIVSCELFRLCSLFERSDFGEQIRNAIQRNFI
jgi:hypothetical protein